MSKQYAVLIVDIETSAICHHRIIHIGSVEECREFIKDKIVAINSLAIMLSRGFRGQAHYDREGNLTEYDVYWDSAEKTHRIYISACSTIK